MTTSKNPNLIADLTALALEIDDDAEERTKELKGLILQLPGAAKAERAAAVKYLQTVTAERDQALAKLRIANDEVSGLREELRLLQDAARGGNQRKRKAVSDENQDEEDLKVNIGTSAHSQTSSTATLGPAQRDWERRLHAGGRAGTVESSDRLRDSSVSGSITAADYFGAPAHEYDCYTPPLKRPRPNGDLFSREYSQSTPTLGLEHRLSKRTPVCGTCAKHHHEDDCDGDVKCGRCNRIGQRMCVYWRCSAGAQCLDESCTFLHDSQWDVEAEDGQRKVNERCGTNVSGWDGS